jgi:hypothetical protein
MSAEVREEARSPEKPPRTTRIEVEHRTQHRTVEREIETIRTVERARAPSRPEDAVQPEPPGTAAPLPVQPRAVEIAAEPAAAPHWPEPPRDRLFDGPPQPAAPAVHVTIGRIEVRAARNSQPPRQERKSSEGPMSLSDYLARRSGGGRA